MPHASCLTDRPLPPLLPGRREYVVQVLLKVVDGTTVDDAVNIMQVCLSISARTMRLYLLQMDQLGQVQHSRRRCLVAHAACCRPAPACLAVRRGSTLAALTGCLLP